MRVSTVQVRRTAYEAVGMSFDKRFPGIYDWDMWIRFPQPSMRLNGMSTGSLSADSSEPGASLAARLSTHGHWRSQPASFLLDNLTIVPIGRCCKREGSERGCSRMCGSVAGLEYGRG